MKSSTARASLVGFAFEECANQAHRGLCETLNREPCRLSAGKRCSYFETSVFPIAAKGLRAQRLKQPIDDHRVTEAFCTAWPAARGTIVRHADDCGVRTCPDCGDPLPPRKRACVQCRQARRRATYRKAKDSARVLSTVSAENHAKTSMISTQKMPEIQNATHHTRT